MAYPLKVDAEKALNEPLAVISSLFRTGALSAEALAQVALDRASSLGWNAYRHLRQDTVLSEAQLADQLFKLNRDLGPLQGIPVSIKDLYGLEGEQTFAGTSKALPARFESSGPFLGSALRQMAIILGKTHTVEFAFGGIGTNAHWPTPYNPWAKDESRAPGGSSSGAGISLCEGSARIALGTDTAGSVRIPAAWTGNVGLKTTKGRWPTKGIVPLSHTLDTPGLLVRSVEDLIYAFNAMDPSDPKISCEIQPLNGVVLARCRKLFDDDVDDDILKVIDEALSQFAKNGASIIERDLGALDQAQALFQIGGPTAIELQRFLYSELPDYIDGLDPNVRTRLQGASEIPEQEYQTRLAQLKTIATDAKLSFDGIDVFVTPTVANRPPKLSELKDLDTYRHANLLALRNTAMVSFLGLCALTLPVGLDSLGLPVGLQLIAAPKDEIRLIQIAHAMEQVIKQAELWAGYQF